MDTQNGDNAQNQKDHQGCGCDEPPLLWFFCFIGVVVGSIVGALVGKLWLSIVGGVLFPGVYHYIHDYRKGANTQRQTKDP